MNQTGGTVNVDTALVIGEASGNDNTYSISAGTLKLRNTVSNNVTAFLGSSQGRGTLNVSGTANVEIDSHIFAGSGNVTSRGALNISGGTVELGKNIRFTAAGLTDLKSGGFLVAGEFGQATVNISGGDTKMDFIQLGRRNNAASQGQATQTGGTVTVNRSVAVGGLSPHNNFYEISAGTLNQAGVVLDPVAPPPPAGDPTPETWPTRYRNAVNMNELQPGLHVARNSTNTSTTAGTFTGTVSNGRLTISGTAAVNIAGGLYNSTGSTPTTGVHAGIAQPGGIGLIEMNGGTLTAASFLNGADANATFSGSGASANYNQTGGAASVGHVTGSGNITVSGGTLNASSLRQASVTVNPGGVATVASDGTSAGTSIVNTLSVSGTGKLDLTNNDVLVNYTGASPEFTLRDKALQARDVGDGGIFFTGSDDEFSDKILAFGEASELGYTEYNGFTLDTDTVIGKYTYYGDANFDGQVTTDDYVAVDLGLGTGDSWVQGDFDLNGVVTTDDYVVVDLNLGKGSGDPLAFADEQAAMIALHTEMFGQSYVEKLAYASEHGWVAASVPEPGALSVLALGAAGLLARRRRPS
jgi:hypothetical protein